MKRVLLAALAAAAVSLSMVACSKEPPPETKAPASADPADGGVAKPSDAKKPAVPTAEKKNTLRDKE
ncbi:MAG: hypothetical protein HZB16_04785 [Armatimonadetes bacterium]|nr:hypothetical protein [Armatimonadota bacterium]